MYTHLYSGRRHDQAVKTIQVCLREGDRNARFYCIPAWYRPLHFYNNRYAYFKKLDYFSTECIYSPDAYRGHARTFLKDLEAARPSAIIDIIHSGEAFEVAQEVKLKPQRESNNFAKATLDLGFQRHAKGADICRATSYARPARS